MPDVDPPRSTATTHAAREHARAQATNIAEFQRTIPASAATTPPDDVPPSSVIWEERIGGGNYSAGVLPRGSRFRLTDTEGDTCVQLLVFNHHQPSERINVADIVKVQWQAYLDEGQLILSDMGRVLLSIESDTAAGHDTFNAISNESYNTNKYQSGHVSGLHPNARDQFAVALTKVGLNRRDIAPAINLFKPVRVADDGSFVWPENPTPTGASITFRAETDVRVVLTVTPHVLDPRPNYTVSPVQVTAWNGPLTEPDDPIRNGSPESLRAFENTENWLLSHTSTTNAINTPEAGR